MKAGRRSRLTYLSLCVVPLLLLAAFNYWNGLRLVDRTVADDVQDQLNNLTADIDHHVQRQETEIRRIVSSKAVENFLDSLTSVENQRPGDQIPADVVSSFAGLLGQHGGPFRLSLFDRNRVLRLQAERPLDASETVVFRTTDFEAQTLPAEGAPNLQFSQIPHTSTWRYSTPLFSEPKANRGALVAELDLAEVFWDRKSRTEDRTGDASSNPDVVVWDNEGRIIYHPQRSLQRQPIQNAFPQLARIAQMQNNGIYQQQTSSGSDFLIAYAPLPRLNITVAVGRDRSSAIASARRWGLAGFALAFAFVIAAALLIDRIAQRKAAGIVRVSEGLTAVAKGQLDQRVELQSTDEARAMADDLNVLMERMRAQYAREAEARQFESFFRLSAMLTHDLKNAIEALSLIVGNMERHFNNEQFRIDAMKSLTSATDKLRALVARLSKPVVSLSGENTVPKKVDLVPVLNRILKATVVSSHHQLEANLPAELFAVIDGEHVEEVFENLILNALEAMTNKPGKLTIAAEKTSRGEIAITVSDTGCGISQKFIEDSLFRPFRTTKKSGVGLGLYTCREVVAGSGGRIEVESVEGIGTTFRVVLPSEVP